MKRPWPNLLTMPAVLEGIKENHDIPHHGSPSPGFNIGQSEFEVGVESKGTQSKPRHLTQMLDTAKQT
jgi:hypothetical protein